jgi:hypothetical protein
VGFALLDKAQAAEQKHNMENHMRLFKAQLVIYAIALVVICFDLFVWRP